MATIKVRKTYSKIKRNILEDIKLIWEYKVRIEENKNVDVSTEVLRDWALELLGDVTELCTRLDEDYNTHIYE